MNKTVQKIMGQVAIFLLLTLFVLLLPLNFWQTQAAATPVFNVIFLGRDETAAGLYLDSLSFPAGHRLKFRILVRNDQLGTVATETRLKVSLPQNSFINAPVILTVFSKNGAVATAQVSLNATTSGGASLTYLANSTQVTWAVDGSYPLEFSNTLWPDGIASDSGVVLGDMSGCSITLCKADITFVVDSAQGNAQAGPAPTPTASLTQAGATTPTPTPTPSATPSAGALPKTGAAEVVLAAIILSVTAIFGLKLRGMGNSPLKRFALPFAIKSHQGRELEPVDLVNNRRLIVKTIKK